MPRHFDSESELIFYGLLTANGAPSLDASAMLQLWKDEEIVIYHTVIDGAWMMAIQLTEKGRQQAEKAQQYQQKIQAAQEEKEVNHVTIH